MNDKQLAEHLTRVVAASDGVDDVFAGVEVSRPGGRLRVRANVSVVAGRPVPATLRAVTDVIHATLAADAESGSPGTDADVGVRASRIR